MCGIFGIWYTDDKSVDLEVAQRATTCLRHRGPDDEGYLLIHVPSGRRIPCGGKDTDPRLDLPDMGEFFDRPFNGVLGFRRLAILDLSPAGHQPMVSPDGRFWIVFNGEIYNYLELRRELEASGYWFYTHSDTEVLLTAYCHWGPQVLTRLIGMFALAVLDTREQKVFLARDFFGIKPLYYTFLQNGFAFASEIKALLELPEVDRQVNPQRLYEYLRFGLTDHGQETLFAQIYQLPAAHYLGIPLDHPHGVKPLRYWQIDLNPRFELSFEEASRQLRELFLENVRLHLRSDVPVGAALSGGIDSSSIVMAMRHIQGKELELHTFSYIADHPAINEEPWVDLVGKASGAIVHKTQPGPQELTTDLEHLISIQDEPFGSTSIYAQYRVFRLAREAGIKVMLDGQGADELLGGYRPYLASRLASLLRQGQWIKAGRFLSRASKLPGSGNLDLLLNTAGVLIPARFQSLVRRLIGKDLAPPWLNATWLRERGVVLRPLQPSYRQEVLREHLYQTVTETSLPMLLRYEDRNSMAFSIESRVPFLTQTLANFILSLPEEYIIAPDGTSKSIFRRAMRGLVPDTVLDRRDKIGFATPEQGWLTGLQSWIEKVLQSETASQIPVLNLQGIKMEWQAILQGNKHFDFRVWRWINLIRWVEQYGVNFR